MFKKNTHVQNIIVDQFHYYTEELQNVDFTQSLNNYIFGTQNLYPYDTHTNYLVLNTNTFVYMKLVDIFSIPSKLKLDIFDNITYPLKWFNKTIQLNAIFQYAKEQEHGQAVIFCHNKKIKNNTYINSNLEYSICPIMCHYIPASKPKDIYSVKHENNLG